MEWRVERERQRGHEFAGNNFLAVALKAEITTFRASLHLRGCVFNGNQAEFQARKLDEKLLPGDTTLPLFAILFRQFFSSSPHLSIEPESNYFCLIVSERASS